MTDIEYMFRPDYSEDGRMVTITIPDGTKVVYTVEGYRNRVEFLRKQAEASRLVHLSGNTTDQTQPIKNSD